MGDARAQHEVEKAVQDLEDALNKDLLGEGQTGENQTVSNTGSAPSLGLRHLSSELVMAFWSFGEWQASLQSQPRLHCIFASVRECASVHYSCDKLMM